jgi:thiamine biosynthesis lipoprotein
MATRFEAVLHGDNPGALRAAGEEALREIERLESQLSLFRPESEIAYLNARAARGAVRVTPALFVLLQQAQRMHQQTGGAFDITVAPLVRCWGFMGGTGQMPSAEEIADAWSKVGMHLVHLDARHLTVQFAREGVMLDLGAIGKGYAIDRAAEILREAGVQSALLHGGTSTVYALGQPPEAEHWVVAIERSDQGARVLKPGGVRPPPLVSIPLRDESLSVSAVWGKSFKSEGKIFGHVMDPRTGQPAARAVLAAVVLDSATETDALSTALLTLGPKGHDTIAGLRAGMRTLVVTEAAGRFHAETRGMVLATSAS